METWDKIQYCTYYKHFVGFNALLKKESFNMTSIRNEDKESLLEGFTDKLIKKDSTKWMDLPTPYKNYINQWSREIPKYDKKYLP